MGNQLAPAAAKQGGSLETGELQNVVVKETLGGGRFLKSFLCLHDNGGLVVVKAFYKRKDATSLASHKQQLQAIRDVLLGLQCPHVWPMQTWWETPSAACMMRQHFFANLYDRLSTRPFLTALEKRWITFQLLHGLSQAHAHGVCHGDIKCENIMVTSWNWLFIVDFASYKPTYLPADNPADFSYYFDTGSRRRCYLAPERFFEGSAAAINAAAPLQPDMDVFSLGCVIAELWLDGRAFFDLSRLLAYRRGEYDPTAALAGVEADIAELVMHMIQRSPGERWSVDHYLTSWPRQLFPGHFSEVLHPFFNSLLDLDPDARLAAVATHYEQLAAAITGDISGGNTQLASQPQPQVFIPVQTQFNAIDAPPRGTQPPAVTGAAAPTAAITPAVVAAEGAGGSKLLAEVDSLLCEVTGVQRRLVGAGGCGGGTPAVAAEDDGICIDEVSQPTSALSVEGVWSTADDLLSEGAHGCGADEVAVTEEWYEHQVRDDASNQWVPVSQAATSPLCNDTDSSSRPACMADVVLPIDGAWHWMSDWQLQVRHQAEETDAEGWQYTATGSTDQPSRRRRRWTRQRRRLGQQTSAAAHMAPADQQQGKQQVTASSPGGAAGRDQGMLLLAVLICTLLRGSRLQESKRAAIMLLFRSGLLCDDDVRLQTIVPYLLTQLSDPSAAVRTLALRCAVQLMASLSRLPPADAKVYHDYLLPSLSLLPNDPEESVRVAYALAVAHLAAAAHEHLLGMQFASTAAGSAATAQLQRLTPQAVADGGRQTEYQSSSRRETAADVVSTSGPSSTQSQQEHQLPGSDEGSSSLAAVRQASAAQQPVVRYDAEIAAVRGAVEKVVLDLVTGTRSSADIKRGLLSHAHQLGLFFGRRDINDLLLPLLITCLNAGEWQLRGSFFGAIAAVGPHTGRDSLDVFLLPCLEQALVDTETAVVCDAVRCLAAVCGHLRKRSLLAAAGKVAPLLRHPSAAVRHSAVAYIAAAARALPPADMYTQLSVMVTGFLQQQPLMLTDEAHLAACLHPSDEQQQQHASALQIKSTLSASRLHQQSVQAASNPGQQPGVGGVSADGGFGSLLTRPSLAAMRQSSSSSSSDKALTSRTAAAGIRLSRTRSTQDNLIDATGQLNLEGSELVLRPTAPVYCLDIDPAVLSSTGTTAAAPGAGASPGSNSGVGLGAAATAAAGAHRGRWGYRLEGFGTAGDKASWTSTGRAARITKPQNAAVGPGLVVQAGGGASGAAAVDGSGAAASSAVAAPHAAAPGNFWSGSSANVHSNFSSSGGGLLTGGLRPALGVGPGGLAVGPPASSSAPGLRPRPKSSHTAAVESISKKQATLQERYDLLCEALVKDSTGLEASDRQQLERLAATLHRLNLPSGNDVRCPAALLTYKMAAVTSRAGPGAAPGATGDSSAPAVYDAVSAAISTGIGQHLPGPGVEGVSGAGGPSWRPRGVLASHLQEHRAAVNCLATSANGAILLSGSDDETVKVWDIRRLERDVTFASRLTYAGQSGRITGLCPVLDGSSVASGSSSGSLHVWRVEYSSKPGGWAPDKYRGMTAVRQLSPGEGSILQVVPWGGHPALLLYTSQRGGVHCCDVRCAADVWHVPAAPSLGLSQHLVADPSGQHWLAQGTSRGWVCLWDVRFLLAVNTWQHPHRCGIDAMSLAVAAPPRLGLQQGSLPRPGVPLLYMSAGTQEVGLWDVLDGRCHQVLRVLNRQESQLAASEPPAALQPPLTGAAAAGASISTRTNWTSAAAAPSALEQQLGLGNTSAVAVGGGLKSGLQQRGNSDPSLLLGGDVDVEQLANEFSTHLAIDQINCPQNRFGGVTALLPLPGGALLAGGADRCVRYWDGSWPERSYIVTGPVWPDDTGIMDPQTNKLQVPSHVYRYSKRMFYNVPVLEERCVGDNTRQVTPDSSPDLGSKLRMHDLVHADSITQLLAVEGASKLLISASRDGCVKVWK